MNDKPTVETRSPAIAELEHKRTLIRAIMQGSEALRNKTYLLQYQGESDTDYKVRCKRSYLDNFVDLAINKATSKIFAKEIKTENLPAETEKLLENIDRQGRALDPFMMDVANMAFQDGISYVMADMPRTDGVVTLADEKALGVRPYAIHIKPCCVLEILTEMIDGVETITRLRVMECLQQPIDGEWGYTEIQQVRVWHRSVVQNDKGENTVLIHWETFRETETAGKKEWTQFDKGATTFKRIYLVPFYTNRTGFMLGAPPFQNIAESTLEHFQLKSDYQAALEMCNFGMYWATGVPDEFAMKVGPRQSLVSSSPEAKFGVMETTGAAVTLSLEAIKAVESRVESAGVNLRVENAGNVTATAAAIDSEDTDAGLKAIAEGFGDSCELLFQYFAEMTNGDTANAGECDFNTDFGKAKGTPQGLTSLDKARALGDISKEAYLHELVRRGELDEAFDVKADIELSDSEGPTLGSIGGAA